MSFGRSHHNLGSRDGTCSYDVQILQRLAHTTPLPKRNLYLYKIESQNLERGVRIVGHGEALHVICLRIQHDMESNMG